MRQALGKCLWSRRSGIVPMLPEWLRYSAKGGCLTVEENKVVPGWISFDRVEIDLAGRRLFVDARETPLEPKAF